jgi:hypothetical protein
VSHVDDPVLPWYLPATQLIQAVAPEREYLPVPQVEQEVALTVELYLPAVQVTHVPLPAYFPAVQLVHPVDPVVATVPAAQFVHSVCAALL